MIVHIFWEVNSYCLFGYLNNVIAVIPGVRVIVTEFPSYIRDPPHARDFFSQML